MLLRMILAGKCKVTTGDDCRTGMVDQGEKSQGARNSCQMQFLHGDVRSILEQMSCYFDRYAYSSG